MRRTNVLYNVMAIICVIEKALHVSHKCTHPKILSGDSPGRRKSAGLIAPNLGRIDKDTALTGESIRQILVEDSRKHEGPEMGWVCFRLFCLTIFTKE